MTAALEKEMLPEAGIPLAWFEVLHHLSQAKDGAMRFQELARVSGISDSGASRRLEQMIKAQLIERLSCPTDRRGVFAHITDKGEAAYKRGHAVFVDGQRVVVRDSTLQESAYFVSTNGVWRHNVHASVRADLLVAANDPYALEECRRQPAPLNMTTLLSDFCAGPAKIRATLVAYDEQTGLRARMNVTHNRLPPDALVGPDGDATQTLLDGGGNVDCEGSPLKLFAGITSTTTLSKTTASSSTTTAASSSTRRTTAPKHTPRPDDDDDDRKTTPRPDDDDTPRPHGGNRTHHGGGDEERRHERLEPWQIALLVIFGIIVLLFVVLIIYLGATVENVTAASVREWRLTREDEQEQLLEPQVVIVGEQPTSTAHQRRPPKRQIGSVVSSTPPSKHLTTHDLF